MHEFIAKHQDKIAGTLSGFDRLVFRGHLRSIGHPQGMMNYLWTNQILLKNFGAHVEKVTEHLKEASLAQAKASGRPVKYLNSSQTDKETIARDILETHPESPPKREGCFNQPGGFPKKNWGRLREKVLTKLYIYAIA